MDELTLAVLQAEVEEECRIRGRSPNPIGIW